MGKPVIKRAQSPRVAINLCRLRKDEPSYDESVSYRGEFARIPDKYEFDSKYRKVVFSEDGQSHVTVWEAP